MCSSILWNLDFSLFSTWFVVQIGFSFSLSRAWWWDSGRTASPFTCLYQCERQWARVRGSACLCEFKSHADQRRCCCHLPVSLYFCVLDIFDSKASFQIVARSQPFGFQRCLWRDPVTSLSDELSYSLYHGGELTSQVPVWSQVRRFAESVKGLEVC